MEEKVGMYVRLNSNDDLGIGKIVEEKDELSFLKIKFNDDFNTSVPISMIKKASFDIRDLIEAGDYVNGKLVLDKWEEPFGAFAGETFIKLDGEDSVPTIRTIKSIVTKEMYSNVEYRIEE